ncbi:hypothetical protein Ga0074812_10565 [Parafrankia irregularis]|uniref:Leucyl aminopeptidase (Aminopeptidase T) n=1 Tax=Parafrankia irregularis TaxID=795642 RepID=A0A0S4QIQ8_9ACTN|nr:MULTISPECIES: hypothetical protein [Parafrankia]MBE3205685.1 hypothetical protein [Parafrankia sp. CH37]CUU55415.1 hypothetical protein Ga0074812_10565 [Parafrankia irregularis]
MTELVVDPTRIRQFGDPTDTEFCLVTNTSLLDKVQVVNTEGYAGTRIIVFTGGTEEFARIMREEVPEQAHVLVMSPECFFQSPPPDVLGPRRKLLGMACNSTPTDLPVLAHFLRCVEATDPDAQEAFSDRFFELAERGDVLEYRNEQYGTVARMRLWDRELVWNQQAGRVDWGEQQIVPAGEISVLPIEIVEFEEHLSLPLDGEIVIAGLPILHSGTPSFSRLDQKRVHSELWPMCENPVRATVENGRITALQAIDPAGQPVVDMLEALFKVDSRYRLVWEIGHAVNTTLELLPGNHAMNEVYGATQGCLHWGIGLTPFTQYHLDIIAPGTVVTNDRGDVLLGVLEDESIRTPPQTPVGLAS